MLGILRDQGRPMRIQFPISTAHQTVGSSRKRGRGQAGGKARLSDVAEAQLLRRSWWRNSIRVRAAATKPTGRIRTARVGILRADEVAAASNAAKIVDGLDAVRKVEPYAFGIGEAPAVLSQHRPEPEDGQRPTHEPSRRPGDGVAPNNQAAGNRRLEIYHR
eukprot:scaffold8995_cov120-Isochrysis_galbana.AAC.9